MIVSLYGKNSGGGASFLEDSMDWLNQSGFKCLWLNFSNYDNTQYSKLKIDYVNLSAVIIQFNNGFNTQVLSNWIKLIQPDVVNHQGHKRLEIAQVCFDHCVPLITGIHFWNGIIDLNPATFNTDIQQNIDKHVVSAEFAKLLQYPNLRLYCCSNFVRDIVSQLSIKIDAVVNAASNPSRFKIDAKFETNEYISQINIHKMKGGELLLCLINELKTLPFLVVQTEPMSKSLDEQIQQSIFNVNATLSNVEQSFSNSIFMHYTDDIKNQVYRKTRILLAPSLVDETFCRTVNEAMCCGIPVISSGKGNIKNLIGDSCPILELNDIDGWKETIHRIYHNKSLWKYYSLKVQKQYQKNSNVISQKAFETLVDSTLHLKYNNIMFLVPFCNQGLGIQTLNYINMLSKFCKNSCFPNFKICVFSFKPYVNTLEYSLHKTMKTLNLCDTAIYYSANVREKVTDKELSAFVHFHKIKYAVIPETCWDRIFEINSHLKQMNVVTCAIPNIEIVRRNELVKHLKFDKIFCNNWYTKNTLLDCGIDTDKLICIGYEHSLNLIDNTNSSSLNPKTIKFLCLGGLNAISRKRCDRVASAFVQSGIQNAHLTITYQHHDQYANLECLSQYENNGNITIINKNLSMEEIQMLYVQHDVSIQVSLCEGLGLGFYESLRWKTPIISLDAYPHKEIVKNDVGWLIKTIAIELKENSDAIVKGYELNDVELTLLFQKIARQPELEINNKKFSISKLLKNQNLREHLFAKHFLTNLFSDFKTN